MFPRKEKPRIQKCDAMPSHKPLKTELVAGDYLSKPKAT